MSPTRTGPIRTGPIRRPGAADLLSLLEQDQVWVGGDGVVVALCDLSMIERARLLRVLRRRARVAWLSSLLRRELGHEAHAAHLPGETAEAWCEARPLVRRLVALNRAPAGPSRALVGVAASGAAVGRGPGPARASAPRAGGTRMADPRA